MDPIHEAAPARCVCGGGAGETSWATLATVDSPVIDGPYCLRFPFQPARQFAFTPAAPLWVPCADAQVTVVTDAPGRLIVQVDGLVDEQAAEAMLVRLSKALYWYAVAAKRGLIFRRQCTEQQMSTTPSSIATTDDLYFGV